MEPRGDGAGAWDADRLAQVSATWWATRCSTAPEALPGARARRAASADAVHLAVHNQGAPIPPELLPHLFEPLQRGEAAAADRAGRSWGWGSSS